MSQGKNSDLLSKRIVLGLVVLLFLGGLCLIFITFLPYSMIRARLDTLAFDGSADFFTRTFYQTILTRSMIIGVLLSLTAGGTWILRDQLGSFITHQYKALTTFVNDVQTGLVRELKFDHPLRMVILGLVIGIGIWVRVHHLFQPIWYDEAYTFLNYASKPFIVGLSFYNRPNNHLLNTLFMRISYLIFGNHLWALRLPVLLSGVLVIPATYLVVIRWFTRNTALLAAGFAAVSYPLVFYSLKARGYIYLTLLFLLLIGLSFYLKNNKNTFGWILFAILSSLGFYAIPVMLYPFGILCLWLIVSGLTGKTSGDKWIFLKGLAGSIGLTIILTTLLYLPVLVVSGIKILVANPFVEPLTFTQFLQTLPYSFKETLGLWHARIPWGIQLLLMIGALVGIWREKSVYHHVSYGLISLVWILAALGIHSVVPPPRVWTFLVPVYIVYSSAGLCWFIERGLAQMTSWIRVSAVGLLCFAWVGFMGADLIGDYSMAQENKLRDAKAAAIFLKDYLKEGDDVGFGAALDAAFHYYYRKQEIPAQYVNTNFSPRKRLIVIREKDDQRSWTALLKEHQMDLTHFGMPKRIKTFDRVAIYVLPVLSEES